MRIILAEHDRKALWALKILLEEEPGVVVVGEAADAQQLEAVAERGAADLVLLDRWLPGSFPIEALIASLHVLERRPIVVVMSIDAEDGRLMLSAGADAFVSKGDQPDWLLQTLRQYAERGEAGEGFGK
jgi:DNA-binding NarL/FixJ family response regulator